MVKKRDFRRSIDGQVGRKKRRMRSESGTPPPSKKRAVSAPSSAGSPAPSPQPQNDALVAAPCCPVSDCDSSGHMNGRDPRHITVSACPLYHNLTPEECRRMRERDAGREGPSSAPKSDAGIALGEGELLQPIAGPLELREPPLDGLTSSYDRYLFRKAQQQLVDDRQREVSHHLALSSDKNYRIRRVVLGKFELATWFTSPYPNDVARMPMVFICEFCLKYVKYKVTYLRHVAKCPLRHPPGDEIYRKDDLSFFEVDGEKHTKYCQNLCLMAKLFLHHKTLYEDVAPFLFYVMTKSNSDGAHTIGYFSKEKKSLQNYNLSCILTFPQYMRQGYGKLLIQFSYLLSREEGKIGSPERPLSDLGLVSYRSYWKEVLVRYLSDFSRNEISIKDISQDTRIHPNDIVSTFLSMGLLKYWKGQYLLVRRRDVIDKWVKKVGGRRSESRSVDPERLVWTPKNYH